MVSGFNIAYVFKHTLVTLTKRLNVPVIKIVMCTNSYLLY